jgi:hypothetical protein
MCVVVPFIHDWTEVQQYGSHSGKATPSTACLPLYYGFSNNQYQDHVESVSTALIANSAATFGKVHRVVASEKINVVVQLNTQHEGAIVEIVVVRIKTGSGKCRVERKNLTTCYPADMSWPWLFVLSDLERRRE